MKVQETRVRRYDADNGMVFDYKEPRYEEIMNDEGQTQIFQQHLYAKTIFLGLTDSIDNYIEVEAPKQEE